MEGTGWAFRLRAEGQDIYRSGFASQAAAFTRYARERLPYLKGAKLDILYSVEYN